MLFRFKLLVLLMFISLIPLLLVRAVVERDILNMGDKLAERSENVLVHKASNSLQRIVEDYARVLGRERQLLESISLLMASKVEGVLYGHSHIVDNDSLDLNEVLSKEMLADYSFMHMGGRQQLLHVDFNDITLDKGTIQPDMAENLASIFRDVKTNYPKLILWIEMSLQEGTDISYPKLQSKRMMRQSRMRSGSNVSNNALGWTLSEVDSFTGKMSFRFTSLIRDEMGEVQGRLSIVIPVDAVLHKNSHVQMYSEGFQSYLVRPAANQSQQNNSLRIVAQQLAQSDEMRHWQMSDREQWLNPTDMEQYSIMVNNIEKGRAGVVGMPDSSGDALWAYAPIQENGLSLLLVVPRQDIVSEAQIAREYVVSQVDEHNGKISLIVFGVAIFVVLISMLLAKLFTRNISILVDTVKSVAKGNFLVRAQVRSSDEIGQLAAAVNKMVPELQERVAMKNHLEVAQEVQQNLLPSENPTFFSLDIAASSSYCDETGGDYYGFIPRIMNGTKSLVVGVGDVSGHGFQAALMMASARAYLRSQITSGKPLAEAVTAVNDLMAEDLDETGRFMTLFALELFEDGSANWVRAGHDPALLYDPQTDQFDELTGQGLPLGVLSGGDYESGAISGFKPGQIIIIGTDGIWESTSENGELFGKERLVAFIRENAGLGAEEIIEKLKDQLVDFRGVSPQKDDMTIAVLKVENQPSSIK